MGRGKLNARTQADLVRLMPIDGREYLFYKALPIHVGIIRGTTADPDGNITMEREALTLEAQAIAMAAHNCGGIVIAQVERLAERGTPAARGEDSGVMVDAVVVAEKPEYHMQTFSTPYSAASRGVARAAVEHRQHAAERPEDHRPARGDGITQQRRGQPGHRHAGGHRKRGPPKSRSSIC